MPTSDLRNRLSAALVDFAWDEWAQMGLLASSSRHSRWAQDPEALVLFTLEVARDDPRLFDEVLDWLLLNARIVSSRRLQTLCHGPEEQRLVGAALDWVALRRRRQAPPRRAADSDEGGGQTLFRQLTTPVRSPDPTFLAHGFIRPAAEPTGKAREPDLTEPINLAFRLRHLLGLGARAEAVRFLITADMRRASVAAVASSAGYAKRNVQDALLSLHAAGAVSLVTVGADQRYGIDRARWAHLLGLDSRDLPVHRDWPQLLGALSTTLRWLDRPELCELSDYLRASQARDLLDEIRPGLAHAGIVTSSWRGGDASWEDLVDTIDSMRLALGPPSATGGPAASFEVYADATGHHRWRLNAANGRIVARSAEAYASQAGAKSAAARLNSNAGAYRYVIDADAAGNYRWGAHAANGQRIAASGESFASRYDAERAARNAQDLTSSAAAP